MWFQLIISDPFKETEKQIMSQGNIKTDQCGENTLLTKDNDKRQSPRKTETRY